ncbi:epidermal growth factor receptor kinase substrate 8-like protein 3b [Nematolebias whitei]|uniref:epidermal growth factor receptor kinase substrate 8-like protein 3b n=1 Tax=Nematolebias whitei TaxID=451745 RepID=UPI00189BB99C|nr:epidermal growth factor receptor kinase substrate 8-like protein 3b [Nematolebias whitei]
MFGNTGPFSYSRGFPQEDFPQQRRPFQQDEPQGSPLQRNGMSRPSGRSIYMQRKEYSEVLNKQPDSFQVRVEHLFTCELDGQEVRTADNCVAKLVQLDAKGRLWPQDMIMELRGPYLLLSDIETKAELESVSLMSIMETKAVLDSCAYNSLLAVTVQERSRRFPQVFLFQCEETGAELIKTDLDKAVQREGGGGRGGGHLSPHREPADIRNNLDRHNPGSFRLAGPRPMQQEETLPSPDYSASQQFRREPGSMPPQQAYTPQQETSPYAELPDMQSSPQMAPDGSDTERNMEILNHVITDLEVFINKIGAAANAPSQQDKNKKKKKKSNTNAPASNLPHWDEYVTCLQKVKYGFNLLAKLDGVLINPSAPEFVHIFATHLGMMVPLYPADLPPTVVSPLLTPKALNLLNQTLTIEEKRMWRSLGDCWSVPRSEWPDANVPPYIPEFYDGWQPPAPSHTLPVPPRQNDPISRSNSQRFQSSRPGAPTNDSQSYSPRAMQQVLASNGPWSPPPPVRPTEPPLYMRVIYNFVARNNQELTVMKDEVIQVVQKSRPWWLVRNSRNEEGNVPPNVLEPVDNAGSMEDRTSASQWDSRGPATLNMSSSPAEVKAWLEYKGFSRITVSSLGVLSGKLLLGMSKEEIRTVCPEEAGKVFFHLQGVKSSLALASEPSAMYNGRY